MLSGCRPELPWGRPAALPDGGAASLARPRPLCLSRLGIDEAGIWAAEFLPYTATLHRAVGTSKYFARSVMSTSTTSPQRLAKSNILWTVRTTL